MNELEPLDPEMRSLLASARATDAAPADVRARLDARLASGLALGTVAGTGVAAHAARLGTGAALARVAIPVIVSFVVGGAVGAAVMRASFTAPLATVVYVDRPVPAPAPRAASTASDAVAVPSAAPSAPAPAPVTSRGDSVASERILLDVARLALERGDGAGALAAAEKHGRVFPGGALVQEREAIAVRALVLLGRTDQARARAGRFVARFPDSLLRPAVEAAVANP